jgi:hypothetical protein
MIKKIVKQWEDNKPILEDYFKKYHPVGYGEIVEKIFELVITGYDRERITVIDDGDYQGTQIYLIPKDDYQPSPDSYLWTNNYYGSCSGCDTLLSIQEDDGDGSDKPTKEQTEGYMTLALHLIQKLKPLNNE